MPHSPWRCYWSSLSDHGATVIYGCDIRRRGATRSRTAYGCGPPRRRGAFVVPDAPAGHRGTFWAGPAAVRAACILASIFGRDDREGAASTGQD